jgi:hypothetical protein
MTMIHFKDSDFASDSKHHRGFIIKPLTTWWMLLFSNLEFCGNICLWMRWMSNPMVIPTLDSSCVVTEMSACKLWYFCGTGGHCFIYKDGRYCRSTCVIRLYMAQESCRFCTSSMLNQVPCLSSTLAESLRDDLLSQCASYCRVMLDVRFDAADHIVTKIKGQRIRGHDLCKGKSRQFCTKYNMTRCIKCFTSCHELSFVFNVVNKNVLYIMFFILDAVFIPGNSKTNAGAQRHFWRKNISKKLSVFRFCSLSPFLCMFNKSYTNIHKNNLGSNGLSF